MYRKAFEAALERAKSLNGELVQIDFAPFCEIAQLLYNSAFVAERYAGIRSFIDANVSSSPCDTPFSYFIDHYSPPCRPDNSPPHRVVYKMDGEPDPITQPSLSIVI